MSALSWETCYNVAQCDRQQVAKEELGDRDIRAERHAHGNDEHVCHRMLQSPKYMRTHPAYVQHLPALSSLLACKWPQFREHQDAAVGRSQVKCTAFTMPKQQGKVLGGGLLLH